MLLHNRSEPRQPSRIIRISLLALTLPFCASCGAPDGSPVDIEFNTGTFGYSFETETNLPWSKLGLQNENLLVTVRGDADSKWTFTSCPQSYFGDAFAKYRCKKTEDIDSFSSYFSRSSTFRIYVRSATSKSFSLAFYVDKEVTGVVFTKNPASPSQGFPLPWLDDGYQVSWVVDTAASFHRGLGNSVALAESALEDRRSYQEPMWAKPTAALDGEWTLTDSLTAHSRFGEYPSDMTPALEADPLLLSRYNGAFFNTSLYDYGETITPSLTPESGVFTTFCDFVFEQKGKLGRGGTFLGELAEADKFYGCMTFPLKNVPKTQKKEPAEVRAEFGMDKERLVFFWTYQGETYSLLLQSSEDVYRLFVPHCLMAL